MLHTDFQWCAAVLRVRSSNGNPARVTPQAAACGDDGQQPADLATPPS
jgi:hypothetical protein